MIMDQQTNKYINSTGTLPHTGDKASGLLTGGPAREKERGREKKGNTYQIDETEKIYDQTNSTGIHESEEETDWRVNS